MNIPFVQRVAGVDEAGRGALAGPVVVAAVILNPDDPIEGLDDSKRLSAKQRELLFDEIINRASDFSIVSVDAGIVDRINVLQATLKGMRDAVEQLRPQPHLALIDGNQAPVMATPSRTIIKGDQLEPCISAASILAKVNRDRFMQRQHTFYPYYGFDRNKGYPTPEHLEELRRFGACELHRSSFQPVRVVQMDLGLK